MKGDKFLERFKKDMDADITVENMISVSKVISQNNLKLFAEKLALHHEPTTINYKAKFGLDDTKSTDKVAEPVTEYNADTPECPRCKKAMVKRSTKKGKNIGNEFWGCSDFPKCKGVIKIDKDVAPKEKTKVVSAGKTPPCPKCEGEMVKRLTKKDDKAGTEFWGCQKFPKCRGVVSISK